MKKILGTLFISVALVANTFAFSDVPQDAWYATYVNSLLSAGIIDDGEFFRPADGLNRAELVKMVIEATGGLDNYEAPPNGTFNDVPASAWFAPYVETAATLGIVSGYKDETGSLTGMFGPGDVVTRSAATKILVMAFDLLATEGATPYFSDVQSSDWFYSYVVLAYQNGIVQGYANGSFGPSKPVIRAEIAKMIALALNPATIKGHVEAEAVEDEVIEEVSQNVVAKPNPALIISAVTQAGADEVLVGRYNFKGDNEGFYVTTLTIVNDLVGDDMGDDSTGTLAVKNIILKYPDAVGFLRTAKRSMPSDGKARFSGLDFFAIRDENSFLEIYAELSTFAEIGPELSGESFRLGIQDVDNDTQTFRAVGAISGNQVTFGGGAQLTTDSDIEPFTIRKSSPVFQITSTTDQLLEGTNEIIEFSVTASDEGSLGLGRFVFEVTLDDADTTGLSLSDFKFYSGGTLIDSAVIYDATGTQDLSPAGEGSLANGTSKVIVSFDSEEIISAGDTEIYSLKAAVSGSADSDDIITRFAEGDEATALTGLTATGNENTGKVFVLGDSSTGIFIGSTDFSQSVGLSRNIIWSDMSAQPHQYPSVSAGVVLSGSGTSDWTNGYLLDINNLDPVILSK